MPVGYSKTPLWKKLGIRESHRVGVVSPPTHLSTILAPLPDGVSLGRLVGKNEYAIVLLFCRNTADLEQNLTKVMDRVSPDGSLWVCWPKKSSALFRDLTEDGIRAQLVSTDLVDVKVCAVDHEWSGLKLVYRVASRESLLRDRRLGQGERKK